MQPRAVLGSPATINGTNLRLRKAGFNSAPSTFSIDGTAPCVAFSPPQFAISEFKIQTSTFDAALGHTMGSTVNVSIKSGTNQLHGEVHEWFRHSALDAPTIFQNRSGQAISIYQDNRYGASAGAPLGFGNRIFNGDLHKIVLPNDRRSVNMWFVPAAQAGFETNSSRQLGSNLRTFPLRFNATRGPNQDKWDFSILKVFKIREGLDCQFRAESFNTLNHPNLRNPNTDPTSASWGVISTQETPRTWQLSLKLVF